VVAPGTPTPSLFDLERERYLLHGDLANSLLGGKMHQENALQFRSYVPTLMELLEDADGMVRDTAKTTVIELFRYAPSP
jgi:hypothetical protein